MRIALFISSLHTGGTQRQITALASGLANRGHDVHLIAVLPGGEFWEAARNQQGVTLAALLETRPRWRVGRALSVPIAPLRLRRYTKRHAIDVVYSMLDWSNMIARLAIPARVTSPLLIWGIRASARQPDIRATIAHKICRGLSRTVPAVIANSHKGLAAHQDAGFDFARGNVVHNGIDTNVFFYDESGRQRLRDEWGVSSQARLVALIGRLDPRKGHDVFIRMAARLARRDGDYTFVCVGPGTDAMRMQFAAMADLLGVSSCLRFVGETADMRAVYSAADIVVSASTAEGFPNVVGEALSCGRACVVTDVGDSAELVGDCGAVVAPDDVGALAAAVVAAWPRRDQMGACGRKRVADEFSVDAMVTNTIQVLERCLSASRT